MTKPKYRKKPRAARRSKALAASRPAADSSQYGDQPALPKQEASKYCGLSVRHLLHLAQQGQIQRKAVRDPHTHRQIVVFPLADLQRIKNNELPPKWVSPAPPQSWVDKTLTPHITPQQPNAQKCSGPLWMTAQEAADYCGLPANFLVHLVMEGKLAALDVGVRPGGRYRISRKDIEELSGERLAK